MQGTPRFIARSVASGDLLRWEDSIFYPMPKLDEDAKSYYIDAYGLRAYEDYRHDNGIDIVHGAKFTSSGRIQRGFVHRPDHDVESIFWVLLYVLIIAEPKDGSGNWDKTDNKEVYECFKEHTIKKNSKKDSRSFILNWNKSMLASALDPKFHSLVPMLYEMRCQIKPEYAELDEEPPKDHLHEVMRRLLLGHILKMEDPIALNPDVELWKGEAGVTGTEGGGSKKSRSVMDSHIQSQRRYSAVKEDNEADY